jgi:hypothetical protein
VKIDAIIPIKGSDNCEAAVVGGWQIMVKKNTFQQGEIGVYFEIDSKVPETEIFAFLEKKHYKIKTQRYTFGGAGNFVSQGLLMHPLDFGWTKYDDNAIIIPDSGEIHRIDDESRFLTKELKVIYSAEEDNRRKANSEDKYKKMSQRRPDIFKKSWAKWMMRREWGRKVMFFFFGKKKDKKTAWPTWVQKTDEERVQCMPWILNDKSEWIATEKIDGSSTTATYRKTGRKKHDYFICSRNVVFDKPDKNCYYDFNPYTEMSEKYHFEDVLGDLVEKYNLEWATLQGETYGAGIQKREYSLKEHEFAGFNLIFSDRGRLNSVEAAAIMAEYGIPWVPIVDEKFILPDTVEELLNIATADSAIDGGMREGLVFRSQDGTKSFKAVSNEFLLKYHN